MQFQTNPQLELAYNFLQFTNRNIFLTGKAGTGKTTFLRNLKMQSPKRMVVVAPTGVAAINAGGVTIHSFFQMSFGPQIPHGPDTPRVVEVTDTSSVAAGIKRFNREKTNIIRSMDLLVIDEISMVRADVLDGIDEVLRRFKNRYQPFGGVQLLMIGDLQQLAPIVKDDEWQILKPYYDTGFFFSSHALKRSNFISIELTQIFRQNDLQFIELLNKVRKNQVDEPTLALLNQRYIPGFDPSDDEGYITLTTHNNQSQQINDTKLGKLTTSLHRFKAEIEGDFPEYLYPTEPELQLKNGAQVMFVKNDIAPEKRFYNGKIGKISAINDDIIEVICPDSDEPIFVEAVEFQNIRFILNETTQEIDEEVIGRFTQFPLKLAWAITIHKSQGLTFEKAIIDARASFAHGQVYVALSRCKSLGGMVLRTPIAPTSIKNDTTVIQFTDRVEQNPPGQTELSQSKKIFVKQLLIELFDFKPIQRQMGYLQKLWKEHESQLLGTLNSVLQTVEQPLQNELIDIALKFDRQIHQLVEQADADGMNETLQERIIKGADYFSEKFESIVGVPMAKISLESDNKAVKKSFQEAIEKLHNEIHLKKELLTLCRSGFEIQSFLETRAKASIEGHKGAKRESRSNSAGAFSKYPEFYNELRNWREDKADTLNIETSRVLPQKTLLDIVQTLPSTKSDLKLIKGMGGTRMQQFGKEILGMVIEFRRKKGMELPIGAEKEVEKAGLTTQETSLDLFKNGMTIPEIARHRGMAVSTIEGHLAHCIGIGEITIEKLVEPEKVKAIVEYLDSHKGGNLSDIRVGLNNQYSFGEIRMVFKYLETTR